MLMKSNLLIFSFSFMEYAFLSCLRTPHQALDANVFFLYIVFLNFSGFMFYF